MSWLEEPALDVHILRDFPPTDDLRTLLFLTFSDPDATTRVDQLTAAQRAILVGGGVTFTPSYPFTVAQHFISVDPQSGVVVATIPSTANPRITNFTIRALVREIQTDPNVTPRTGRAYIRFHIHDAFVPSSLRLTPARLTVGLGSSSSGFGVLGEFTDGVAGDLRQRSDLVWQLFEDLGGNHLRLVDPDANGNSTFGGVTLAADGAITVAPTTDPNLQVKVGVILPSYDPSNFAEALADLAIGPSWTRPFIIRQLAGPGPDRRNQIPNVLFLSEGFTAAQETVFHQYAANLVNLLRDNDAAMPFNQLLIQNRMNIYSGFVASPDSGASVMHEMRYATAAQIGMRETDEAADPGDPGDATPKNAGDIDSISRLLYAVGMPTPADASQPGETRAQALKRLHDKILLLQTDLFSSARLTEPMLDQLFDQWTRNADRFLALTHDTAFAVGNGFRPNATDNRTPGVQPRDLGFGVRNTFALVAGARLSAAGPAIGDVWQLTGKDRALVVRLCAGLPNCGETLVNEIRINTEQGLATTLSVGLGKFITPIFTTPVPGTHYVALDPDPPSVAPFLVTIGTMLHELAHSMECHEEYRFNTNPLPSTIRERAVLRGNVVPEQVLLLDPAEPDNETAFHMENALWGFFPRIRAAGVLVASPDPTNQRIRLRPGHGKEFAGLKDGDPLFLRTRPLLGSMAFLDVIDARRGRERFAPTQSDPFTFKGIAGPAEPDTIIVQGLQSNVLVWEFPVGRDQLEPMLFAPHLDAAAQPLSLTAPVIRAHIEQFDKPLNGRKQGKCTPFEEGADKIVSRKVIPTNLPASILSAGLAKGFLSRIVGLIDGGAGYSCEIFHPTGSCAMANSNDPFANVPTSGIQGPVGGLTAYCHVCRYLLVDYLDPRLHGALDKLYPEVP